MKKPSACSYVCIKLGCNNTASPWLKSTPVHVSWTQALPLHTPQRQSIGDRHALQEWCVFFLDTLDRRPASLGFKAIEWLPHEIHVWGKQRRKRHKEQHRLDFPMKSCIIEASTILIFATLLNQKTYCIKDIKSHFYNQYFIFQWL